MTTNITTAIIVPAASYDLTTLAVVKDELALTQPDYDSTLSRWITAVSFEIRNYCARTFQLETVRDVVYPTRDPFPQVLIGGVRPLQLTRWPVVNAASPSGTAPPLPPALTAVTAGSLPAQICYVQITYVTPTGETAPSAETAQALGAGNVFLLTSPIIDNQSIATGYNVYAGSSSGGETMQNTTPIAIGTNWTLPVSGLITGAQPPAYIQAIENGIPLAEGIDFFSDAQPNAFVSQSAGWLTRIDNNGWPKKWPPLPITVQYQAGFATIPQDVADAAIVLVKHRYYARGRDPYLRQESIHGVYEAHFWIAQGPGSNGNLPPDVEAKLEKYRVVGLG